MRREHRQSDAVPSLHAQPFSPLALSPLLPSSSLGVHLQARRKYYYLVRYSTTAYLPSSQLAILHWPLYSILLIVTHFLLSAELVHNDSLVPCLILQKRLCFWYAACPADKTLRRYGLALELFSFDPLLFELNAPIQPHTSFHADLFSWPEQARSGFEHLRRLLVCNARPLRASI